MAITWKPQSHQSESRASSREAAPAQLGKTKDLPRLSAFRPSFLKRVDAAAKARGVSRAARILMVASRALDSGSSDACGRPQECTGY